MCLAPLSAEGTDPEIAVSAPEFCVSAGGTTLASLPTKRNFRSVLSFFRILQSIKHGLACCIRFSI